MTHTTNRLAEETSPYLLQHAHNPVDWYAWGAEAFEAARSQNKPIFLSVGYSTCYWCHVMERQCFENDAIARQMNEQVISIKVDREERPDVDQLYMLAVQVMTRHGGWPMSVFLTPDLRPFYGGTYFPPDDARGRPGFGAVLRGISDAFANHRDDVTRSGEQMLDILQQLAEPTPPSQAITLDEKLIDNLIQRSVADYEPAHGGFGAAPKFPRQTLLELLLSYTQSAIGDRQSEILPKVRHTLDAMANGGIRDHLGGGFHRYSTDAEWLVPHFEIMLYDNAMLAWCYVEAYRQTEELRYARIARGIFDFVLREMTSPQGAFYTAFDAEVDAQEGGSYLWTADEIEAVLGPEDATLFNQVYGVDRGPNFADPHGGSGAPDKNILYLPDGAAMEDDPRIVKMREKLYAARRQRKQPLLDTKIITSWNALMIRALAYGGRILQEDRYLQSADAAARFLTKHHQTEAGALWRTSRDGVKKYAAFLDDYAFLIQAMLALHDAGADETWRESAHAMTQVMLRKFGDDRDDAGGFFFTDADATDLIVRQKIGTDSPLPSGNAVAAMVLLALDERAAAERTLAVFAGQLQQQGEGMSGMAQAAMQYVQQHGSLDVEARRRPAAQRPLSPLQLAQRVVQVEPVWHEPTRLELQLHILRPFHINSNQPAAGMIATQLRLQNGAAAQVEYPAGEIYTGEASIIVNFRQPPDDALRMSLRYHACDESACLPEVTKELEIATPSPSGRGQG